MTATFSTKSMQQVLTYPFKDPKWMEKFLVGIGLTLGCMFVPIVPGLFVTGYIYQIIHQLTVEKGELRLPEWTDWTRLLQDGFRLTAVTFLYSLPALIIGSIGFALYFVAMFIVIANEGSDPNAGFGIFYFLSLGIMMISMAISTILMSVTFIAMPAIIGHTVAHDSFAAGFNFSGWWKVMKANLGGFAVTFLIIFGLVGVMYMLTQVFYLTIVLICLMFIVPLIAGFYISLVGAARIGQSYREGVDKLEGTKVVEPIVVVPEVPVLEEVKPRAKRTKKME